VGVGVDAAAITKRIAAKESKHHFRNGFSIKASTVPGVSTGIWQLIHWNNEL
jgi:hypothetical protein